jgi:peptidoglycan-associated lipoprotein
MLKFAHTHRLVLIILALLSGLMITGCRGPQKPDPSMTAVRGLGTGTGPGSPDWISPEDIANAGALGLETRDPSMMDDGNRLTNLFSPIYFEFDQSFIRPADRGTLQEAAQYLQNNPNAKLLAEGHCDWRGTTEYNMALGDRRAGSVTAYLEQLGISPDRLETVSKGDLDAVTEATDEQMRNDRRADLIIIP